MSLYQMDKKDLSSLLKKYQQGNCTKEEEALLFGWLDALEAEASAEVAPLKSTDMDAIKAAMMEEMPILSTQKRRYTWLKAAAVLLPLIAGTYFLWPRQQKLQLTADWHTISNSSHHIQKCYLPDSSVVYLGAYSTLQYNSSRKVILKEGKAFFDVRTNPAQAFIVTDASGVRTTVLGTSFIAEYNNKVSRIAVATGKVSVQSGTRKTVLTPDQRITCSKGNVIRDVISSADLLAWAKGEIILRNASIYDLVLAIREHYGITATTKLDTKKGSYNLRISDKMPLPALLEVVEKISYKPKIHFKLQQDQLSIE
ncbi:FecR family protein [Chitinophaga sancti]|uniref:FecR domain-containing protein n=2 Tax=Chitinophaga sancti TaxID=1004 RepID=A0ABZ0XD06_9BACT|nr:FecR domain-containing protein [Chitinophaga sancti]WQD59500.1 FecR domain-containing protein [Chitinophaga sancti]WQG88365.1 FecR domain-containing protein [Chitinophaga sancti]